jgi:sporulation protein YlmC with PRC-barrel domain
MMSKRWAETATGIAIVTLLAISAAAATGAMDANWMKKDGNWMGKDGNWMHKDGNWMRHRDGNHRGKGDGNYSARLLNANQLIGASVINLQNEKLGSIKEVVLNASRDRVAYVSVGYGGVAGVGDKHVAIPFSGLVIETPRRDKIDKIVLNASKKDFDATPIFDTKHWPDQGDARWSAPPSMGEGTESGLRERAAGAMREGEAWARAGMDRAREAMDANEKEGAMREQTPEMARKEMRSRRLTEIVGMTVKNYDNEDMGDIDDVVLDLREGRPVYAVIGFGGFLGLGEKMAAVPWPAVDILPRLATARIDAGKDVLTAIAYEQGSPPDLANMNTAGRIYERFKTEPYWQTFGYVEASPAKGMSSDAWKAGSKYNSHFDAKAIVTKKGTITSVGTFMPAADAAPGIRLQIRTDDGKTTTVNLGPRDYAARKGFMFHYGDEVQVTGSLTKIDGRSVIMATDIQKGDKTLEVRDKSGEPKWENEDMD